ncbi:MAG: hypothetical protein PHO37_14935 [Kiritimatiellae bacterium]|nr:hypothetical protein [Kiritimatiellia bacterium]
MRATANGTRVIRRTVWSAAPAVDDGGDDAGGRFSRAATMLVDDFQGRGFLILIRYRRTASSADVARRATTTHALHCYLSTLMLQKILFYQSSHHHWIMITVPVLFIR